MLDDRRGITRADLSALDMNECQQRDYRDRTAVFKARGRESARDRRGSPRAANRAKRARCGRVEYSSPRARRFKTRARRPALPSCASAGHGHPRSTTQPIGGAIVHATLHQPVAAAPLPAAPPMIAAETARTHARDQDPREDRRGVHPQPDPAAGDAAADRRRAGVLSALLGNAASRLLRRRHGSVARRACPTGTGSPTSKP